MSDTENPEWAGECFRALIEPDPEAAIRQIAKAKTKLLFRLSELAAVSDGSQELQMIQEFFRRLLIRNKELLSLFPEFHSGPMKHTRRREDFLLERAARTL
jgi:hypothetical protein